MKKIILLFSLLYLASLSLYAQNRPRIESSKKKDIYTKRVPTKKTQSTSSNKKRPIRVVSDDARAKRTTDYSVNRGRTVYKPIVNTQRENRDVTRHANSNYNRNRTTRTNDQSHLGNQGRSKTSGRIGYNRHRVVKPPPRKKVVHYHVHKPKMHVHIGFDHHHIVDFPMCIHEHYYYNDPIILFQRYIPSKEYPWAIYNSENNPDEAFIEGKVVDVTFSRRTGQFSLHFGRRSPYHSATVVLSKKISQRFIHNKRYVRKLRGEYVSISGVFFDFGNVPTIKAYDIDQIFVDETPFIYFIY